jgi:hypothetical protein
MAETIGQTFFFFRIFVPLLEEKKTFTATNFDEKTRFVRQQRSRRLQAGLNCKNFRSLETKFNEG